MSKYIDAEKLKKAYDEALEKAREIKEKIMYSHLSTESCKAVSEYYKCGDAPTLYGRKAPFGVFDNVCVNFVHELQHALQHALRLCRIEKEIIL